MPRRRGRMIPSDGLAPINSITIERYRDVTTRTQTGAKTEDKVVK